MFAHCLLDSNVLISTQFCQGISVVFSEQFQTSLQGSATKLHGKSCTTMQKSGGEPDCEIPVENGISRAILEDGFCNQIIVMTFRLRKPSSGRPAENDVIAFGAVLELILLGSGSRKSWSHNPFAI